MNIDQYENALNAESEKLIAQLATLDKGRAAIYSKFDEIDSKECIPLAHDLVVAREAQSPTVFELEGKLKLARWRRDALKTDYQRQRTQLIQQIKALTSEIIAEFHLSCLEKIQNLSKLYTFQRLKTITNPMTDKVTVKISHNAAALSACRDFIFAAINEIRGMDLRPRSEIKNRIAELENEIRNLKYKSMQIAEVSESGAEMMRPERLDSGIVDKINSLNARVDALQRG